MTSRPAPRATRHPRQRLRPPLVIAGGLALLIALSGCGGDGVDPVALAQADVTAKEKTLTDAQAAAAAAEKTFCTASSGYITALDRYGDVLNATTVTVGDVRDAGADLKEPKAETVAAAEDVTSTRDEVAAAEEELAKAQSALAAAEASAAGEPAPDTTVSPPDPPEAIVPAATVARVQQADADFTETAADITDGTPLREAAEQFNAAAVALEMSWLAVFAESGCLTDAQQEQAALAVRDYTVALQEDLATAGYFEGEPDGVYGPQTVAAVQALQAANDLPQTGTVDKATEAALREEVAAADGSSAEEEMASTAALQQTLALAGYWDGPIDGQWTDELTDALQELQNDLGVEPTGEVDAATIAAFQEVLSTVGPTAAASATPTPTPEPTDSDEAPVGESPPDADDPAETMTPQA